MVDPLDVEKQNTMGSEKSGGACPGWVPGAMWGAMWIFSFGWPMDVEVVRTEIVSNFQKT